MYKNVLPAIKCPTVFATGNVSEGCDPSVGTECGYQCNTGYESDPSIQVVTCRFTGEWNLNLTNLCMGMYLMIFIYIPHANVFKSIFVSYK